MRDHYSYNSKSLPKHVRVALPFQSTKSNVKRARFGEDTAGGATSTYREDFMNFSSNMINQSKPQNINTVQGAVLDNTPSSPMTTTFRLSYKGESMPPAVSCKPTWMAPAPIKFGTTGYSYDYCSKPLSRRSPPLTKQGNVLHKYPSNVVYPYQQPGQTITMWKPFPVLPPVDGMKANDLLAKISRDGFLSTYRQDYLKSTA